MKPSEQLSKVQVPDPSREEATKKHFTREVIPVIWHTQQINSELEQFQRLVADVPMELVLEIGSAQGGTASLWALMLPKDGKVVSVDKRLSNKIYTWVEEVNEKIVQVIGDSHNDSTVEAVREVLGGRKVDLLFIDGDHEQEGAERDFVKYKQFVKEGGIVAFHDIAHMITGLWGHIINTYPLSWEITHVAGRKDNGIGVVRISRAIAYTAKFAKIDPRWYDDM